MSVKKEFRQTCQEHVWITFNPEIILIIIIKKKLINKKKFWFACLSHQCTPQCMKIYFRVLNKMA